MAVVCPCSSRDGSPVNKIKSEIKAPVASLLVNLTDRKFHDFVHWVKDSEKGREDPGVVDVDARVRILVSEFGLGWINSKLLEEWGNYLLEEGSSGAEDKKKQQVDPGLF